MMLTAAILTPRPGAPHHVQAVAGQAARLDAEREVDLHRAGGAGRPSRCSSAIASLRRAMPALLFSDFASTSMSSRVTP